ncbi:rnf141 [Symbiodinium sp. CCMP2592]|nr:rnf141 [Symbiodinium sp. CCMP2592]
MLLLAATFLLVSPALKSDWAVYVLPYAAFQLLLLTILLIKGVCTETPKGRERSAEFRIWAQLPVGPVGDRDGELVTSQTTPRPGPEFLVHRIARRAKDGHGAVIERIGVSAKMECACPFGPRLGPCCICMEEPEVASALLPCGHTFCEPCIAQWSMSGSDYSSKCPVCRADFAASTLDGADS